MESYITDEHGTWLIDGNIKMLVEPSDEYMVQMEIEKQRLLEQELLESLKPMKEDVVFAKIELYIINLLLELGVF